MEIVKYDIYILGEKGQEQNPRVVMALFNIYCGKKLRRKIK